MNKLTLLLRNKQRLLPILVVFVAILLSGSAAYIFAPQTSEKRVAYKAKPTQQVTSTPQISSKPEKTVLGSQTRTVTPRAQTNIPTPTAKQENASSNSSAQSPATGGTSANNTTSEQEPTLTQVPTQAQATATVSVSINAPDGASSFTVEHNEGMTVCDVLQKAEDTGKIKSVTFDDSYMSTLKSKYVSEINGYPNNWTFTVNGSQPLGCSLSQPKPNDTIVWKFG